jgi:OOP family OmpA-OmpF porin
MLYWHKILLSGNKFMKSLRDLLLTGFCLLSLNACTGLDGHDEIETLNNITAVGSPFNRTLVHEYRNYVNHKVNVMFDYTDALHFARKALAAAGGETVMPEPINDWDLTPDQVAELYNARGRLINAFDLGAHDIAPQQAAIAQARFDCWVEQQEESTPETIHMLTCKSSYMKAISILEEMIQPSVDLPPAIEWAQEEVIEENPLMRPEDAMYLVFFDFNSYKLDISGLSVIGAVSKEISENQFRAIHIIGHADSSGSKAHNSKLAMARAHAVRDALIERGVPDVMIRIDGRGENELLVRTSDNVREPANRRVQITFE